MKLRISMILICLSIIGGVAVDSARAQNWTPQSSGTANLLNGVWFTDPNTGWIVGDVGTSLATVDGGQNWSSFFLTPQDLQGVAFADASLGLIVGDNGLIFRTVNGGVNWSPVASGTGVNLAAVAFGSGGAAYAVGRDGVILRSSDDGVSWTVVETGADRYRDVWAVGPLRAWIVGEGGIYRRSTDGGLTWSTQTLAGGSDLKGIHFIGETEGWAGGQNDTMLYSNDGGLSWASRDIGINVGIDAVQFLNGNDGWALGGLGIIYHSTNGGLSWVQEPSGTTNELNNLHFTDLGHGWAVGDLGTVLNRLDVTGVDDLPVAAGGIELSPNFPNPFNPKTEIRFHLASPDFVTLGIHDSAGRLIRVLASGNLAGGDHALEWNGQNDEGEAMPSGVYYARLVGSNERQAQKLVLMK